MSRVLPILFNTEMVQAILDNRKTVTRRVIKNIDIEEDDGIIALYEKHEDDAFSASPIESAKKEMSLYSRYRPGDVLYIRETWSWEPCWDCGMDTDEHNCCDESAHKVFNHDKGEWGCYLYRASFEDNVYPSVGVWHPSIHMPKEAARIWLRVTNVRVERLQDITDIEAEKEGAQPQNPFDYDVNKWPNREHFKEIWNSTVKKRDIEQYGWNANPWVWVIEFERCEKPEGET